MAGSPASSTDQRSSIARCRAAISPSFVGTCSSGTSCSPKMRKKPITASRVNPSCVPSSAARASAFARASLLTAICCEKTSTMRSCSSGFRPKVIGLLVMLCAATPPGASIRVCAAIGAGVHASKTSKNRRRRKSPLISLGSGQAGTD